MSVRQVIDRGPLVPLRRPNSVGSEELAGDKVIFADHTRGDQWMVIDDQHAWDLEDME